jgi:hypothetical protein
MNCPLLSEQTADVLLDYSAGRLEAAKAATLQTHMLSCDPCSAFLAEQAELWAALDSWEAPEVTMSFNRRLWRNIELAAGRPWLHFGAWKPAFPLAAAALVIMIGFVYDHKSPQPVRNGGVSITEIDQVEKTLDDMQLMRQFEAAREL